MSHPIDAVLFDAGNTLVFVNPHRCLDIYREVGIEACDVRRFREAEGLARAALASKVEEGSAGTESHMWQEYFQTIFRESGVPEPLLQDVAARVKEVHDLEHLWDFVDEDTPGALQAILDAGYRLAVISNADGRVEALLEDRGLTGFFEFVLDSHVVGVEKPDPAIFRAAVDRLGVEPDRCLYVGDLYPVDVVGARRAGLRALLLDPFDALTRHDDVDRIRSVGELPRYLERLGAATTASPIPVITEVES